MKIINYQLCTRVNRGTEDNPVLEDVLSPKEIICSEDMLAANEKIALREAYNGEYTIVEEEVIL